MNIGVHVSFQVRVFTFSGYMPRSGIAGSYGNSIFSFFSFSSFFFFFFAFFRAAPEAYGGSQAGGLIGAVVPGLHHTATAT